MRCQEPCRWSAGAAPRLTVGRQLSFLHPQGPPPAVSMREWKSRTMQAALVMSHILLRASPHWCVCACSQPALPARVPLAAAGADAGGGAQHPLPGDQPLCMSQQLFMHLACCCWYSTCRDTRCNRQCPVVHGGGRVSDWRMSERGWLMSDNGCCVAS